MIVSLGNGALHYTAPWKAQAWSDLLAQASTLIGGATVAGSVIPGVGTVLGFAIGSSIAVNVILGSWLYSYYKYRTPSLPDVKDVAQIMQAVAPKLTAEESINLLAYLSKKPSNFDLYWSAWKKLNQHERSLIQSWVVKAAEQIPIVSDEWQEQMIREYCTSRPGGCGVVKGSTVGQTEPYQSAEIARKEAEKKAEERGECADYDIACKLGRKLKPVVIGAAVVIGGILLYKVTSK